MCASEIRPKPDEREIDNLSELYKAFGSDTRLKILWLLMEQERCVGELAEYLDMTESAISHQLRVLRSARLVYWHKSGKNVIYQLHDKHVRLILETTYQHVAKV